MTTYFLLSNLLLSEEQIMGQGREQPFMYTDSKQEARESIPGLLESNCKRTDEGSPKQRSQVAIPSAEDMLTSEVLNSRLCQLL
ncbi:guanylate cyclase soluble subunit beta-2-like [Arapaima gigas]